MQLSRRQVWQTLGALVAIKAILLALDPTIRFYLGDSIAYLHGALDNGRLPDDRSFTYSMLLRALVRPFERLSLLGVWQSLAGVCTAFMLWWTLVVRFGVAHRVAFIAACVLALEPAQLYYERMVLAETFGLLVFVAFFALASSYLASGGAWRLPIVALLGLAAASLRLNYLPVVLVLSLLLPILALVHRGTVRVKQVVAHSVIALASVAMLHGSYVYWVGQIFSQPPAYLGRAGFMQLGLVMPLVRDVHLARAGVPHDIQQSLKYPLADPDTRMRHLWAEGGFMRELRRRGIAVEPTARALASMAIADDPLGIVRLGLHTTSNYFRREHIRTALENDLGRRAIPEDILWGLREYWHYDAADVPRRVTLVSRYFEIGTAWLVACLLLLAPLSIVLVMRAWRTSLRGHAVLAGLTGIGLVMAHVLFVPVAFFRYMHPLPFFVVLAVVGIVWRSDRSDTSGRWAGRQVGRWARGQVGDYTDFAEVPRRVRGRIPRRRTPGRA